MDREHSTLRFLTGAAIGGWTGAKFILLYHSIWWAVILGVVLGGILGGLIFCYREILRWASLAWKRAGGRIPERGYWKDLFWVWMGMTTLFLIPWPFLIAFGVAASLGTTNFYHSVYYHTMNGSAVLIIIAFLVSMWMLTDTPEFYRRQVADSSRLVIRQLSFLSVWFYYIPKKTFFPAIHTVLTVLKFLWHLGRLIWSDPLVHCALSAATGAFLGSRFGEAIYGGIFGFGFGILTRAVPWIARRLAPAMVRK